MSAPLIILDRIAVRQRDRWLLNGLSWCIHQGEQWLVSGPNGAGKTTLAKAIAGQLPVVQGRIDYPAFGRHAPLEDIAYVASDARREIWRRERDLSFARDFAGQCHAVTYTRDFLNVILPEDAFRSDGSATLEDVAARCRIRRLLDRPLTAISTGELSRVLIARQLLRRPRMLILDEPFEGMDRSSRARLMQVLEKLAAGGLPMLLITHRTEERLAATTHVLELVDGHVQRLGPVAGRPTAFAEPPSPPAVLPAGRSIAKASTQRPPLGDTLIDMQRVTVRYGGTTVLDGIDWSVHAGEHWAISGANGAGKSTLLQLVSGDCLQVHANRIRLFGKSRGADQSLAAVRRQLGIVNHTLAAGYQKRMRTMDVVCSGFFESVGLYRHCDDRQRAAARVQIERMGMATLMDVPFNHLSQGQRQLVLIARAMVKRPRLLLLDEPLSGLDRENRERVVDQLTAVGRSGRTGLIVVSHHVDDIPPLTTHHLHLDRGRVVHCGPYTRG